MKRRNQQHTTAHNVAPLRERELKPDDDAFFLAHDDVAPLRERELKLRAIIDVGVSNRSLPYGSVN